MMIRKSLLPATDTIWLDESSIQETDRLLRGAELLGPGQQIETLERAGEGNMNITLRVLIRDCNSGKPSSFVIKQARPFVAKYDSIPAPLERIHFESSFYEFVASDAELGSRMPRKLAFLPEQHLIVLQDLGRAADATSWYCHPHSKQLHETLQPLLAWLNLLHERSRKSVDLERFENLKLRQLNHTHIFKLPFQHPSSVDLDRICPGLERSTQSIRQRSDLRKSALDLGQEYLSKGDCLLHGDFYPGSWLLAPTGPYVIDPEFCFAGRAEFDVGIMLAHLLIIGVPNIRSDLRKMRDGVFEILNWDLAEAYAAIEILRRILGVAQLPLTMNLHQRLRLIEQAISMLGLRWKS